MQARRDRRYRRFNLAFPVRLKFLLGVANVQIDSMSKNVSIGDLLVRSTIVIPTHTELSFTLSVYGKEAIRPIYLMGQGEVVRVCADEREGNFLVAIECKVPVTELEEYLPM